MGHSLSSPLENKNSNKNIKRFFHRYTTASTDNKQLTDQNYSYNIQHLLVLLYLKPNDEYNENDVKDSGKEEIKDKPKFKNNNNDINTQPKTIQERIKEIEERNKIPKSK